MLLDQYLLTVRSGPPGRVSNARGKPRVGGNQSWCCPPFETRAARTPQGEVVVVAPSLRRALLAQLAVEIVEADPRALLAAGDVVVAVEEGALLSEDQPRAAGHGEELDGRQ
jgi:hypothetical protein